jgi:hypothetical protein
VKIHDDVVRFGFLKGWAYHEDARWVRGQLLRHGGVSFERGGEAQAAWWKWRQKATFFDNGGCSREDYNCCSIRGQMGMKALRTNV